MSKIFGISPRIEDGGQLAPDPEVVERAKRRRFTAEYKRRILQEAANCKQGELGALLRREGLYSSHLSSWRQQLSKAEEVALSLKKRGRKPAEPNPLAKRVEDLERENEQLQKKLSQAEAIIDVQKSSEILGIGPRVTAQERLDKLVSAAEKLAPTVGVVAACRAIGVSRTTLYRRRKPVRKAKPRKKPDRALNEAERQAVLEALHSPQFIDKAPAAVYATLLDEGTYLCSISTMYRILRDNKEVRERRNQLSRPNYEKPELLATGPNQVWSWDITKLRGPAKWNYFYLYVIIDIYSRYVVDWMLADRERAELAKQLIAETIQKQEIRPGPLTIHADRGSSMRSKPVALLLADLGVTKTHSSPYTSDDNPFSEAQFKTLKYHPTFPSHFGSIVDARAFCRGPVALH